MNDYLLAIFLKIITKGFLLYFSYVSGFKVFYPIFRKSQESLRI